MRKVENFIPYECELTEEKICDYLESIKKIYNETMTDSLGETLTEEVGWILIERMKKLHKNSEPRASTVPRQCNLQN